MTETLTAFTGTPRRSHSAANLTAHVLMVWALAVIIPLFGTVGFTVAVDSSGYFRLNGFGTYRGDELLIKSSLMQHRPHNALLLGDSRAAFTDPGGIDGLTFFNAASGGASLADADALLRRHDLEDIDLVVLMAPVGDIAGRCGTERSRLDDPLNLIRYGATFDAFGQALSYLQHRISGAIPDHQLDGTRYPDSRVLTPAGWDGTRDARYQTRVAAAAREAPLHSGLRNLTVCGEMLRAMQARIQKNGGEFLVVLAPINRDLLMASGTDMTAVRRMIQHQVVEKFPFVVDFTASDFSDRRNFPPRDPVHFRPEVGGTLLSAAVEEFCERNGTCTW